MIRPATSGQKALLSCIVFASVGGAGTTLALQPPEYEASSQVVITPLGGTDAPVGMPVFRELGDPIRTIETAAALLHTRGAAQLSAARLGQDWTADEVYDAIRVEPLGQTNLVEIVGRASEPEQAAAVANAYLEAALDLRSKALSAASTAALAAATQELTASPEGSAAASAAQSRYTSLLLLRTYGDPSAIQAQEAAVPVEPAGLPRGVVLALSVIAGLFAATGVAALLPSRRTSVTRGASAPHGGVATAFDDPSRLRAPVTVGAAQGDADRV